MNSLISILIPAYNTAQYLAECIESILSQTYPNIEVIIIDDGSTDDTFAVAEGYLERDSRIRVIHTDHNGVAETRNACLAAAGGDYILFVDSDDWIDKDTCRNLIELAVSRQADIVFSGMNIIRTDGTNCLFGVRSSNFPVGSDTIDGIDYFIRMVETGNSYPMVAGNLYCRRFIVDNNIVFKGEFHEDEYFTPYSLVYARKVSFIPSAPYYYRKRSDSIMHSERNLKARALALGFIAECFAGTLTKDEELVANTRYIRALYAHIINLQNKAANLYELYLHKSKKDLIIIQSERSISSKYGIGTYIRSLCKALIDLSIDIIQIELKAYDINNVVFSAKNGLPCYSFPANEILNLDDSEENEAKYQMGIFYFLASKIGDEHKILCHFNTFNYETLAGLLRERLHARIVFTVHYTDWGFKLYGDKTELIRILESPTNESEIRIKVAHEKERRFLNEKCDCIIAIARHSYESLNSLYGISLERLHLIYNEIAIPSMPSLSYSALRAKYGFDSSDIIIIYAGRITKGKGVFELIEAFSRIAEENPALRLLIAGDGAFVPAMRKCSPYWNRIHFTGFVKPEILVELYALSNLGIVPSLHEEFGYVAAEMAYCGLPVIVNPQGGLYEIASLIEGVVTMPLRTPLSDAIYEAISQHVETFGASKSCFISPHGLVNSFSEQIREIYSDLLCE